MGYQTSHGLPAIFTFCLESKDSWGVAGFGSSKASPGNADRAQRPTLQ